MCTDEIYTVGTVNIYTVCVVQIHCRCIRGTTVSCRGVQVGVELCDQKYTDMLNYIIT